MAAFYGTVKGSAQSEASRQGSTGIRVSAQSWKGSVIVRLSYAQSGELMVEVQTAEGSASSGYTAFYGTLREFQERLKKGDEDE